jgi:alpha-tubulin suppressor-like RCC1 family protein
VWGTGPKGQLGLGKYILSRPYPTVIPALKGISIRHISAGPNHVLGTPTYRFSWTLPIYSFCVCFTAISSEAHLYSWGDGSSGKLGHCDFENKYEPTIVQFFLNYYVECAAAGDSHRCVHCWHL